MFNTVTTQLIEGHFDCLILVHPQIKILETVFDHIRETGISVINIGKELSEALIPVTVNERSRFVQKWLLDILTSIQTEPVLCIHIDLLFEPSLKMDPLALFRQASRSKKMIVLWAGEYSPGTLSYAIPEHCHFKSWRISESLLQYPAILIRTIDAM